MPSPSLVFDQLRLVQMSRSFGSFNALREIDLTIDKGEFIALLGPSGCGKSTALNCIAGLLGTTGGGIYVDDRRIDHLKPEDRGFGMVFQNYALFPHMTVRANVGFGLKMRGVDKDEIRRRADEALEMVRLVGQGDKLPGQLSGGQQQRVAIARAIVIEPPLVLMDEPLSNLDAKLRLEMRAEIRRIHNQLGATTIYVTHDQGEALSLADRIVVLSSGTIRQVGTPVELYESPNALDVAEFMGFRNHLSGKVIEAVNGRATIDFAGARLVGEALGEVRVGEEAVLAARPNDVTTGDVVNDDGTNPPPPASGTNTVNATVETIEYRGREFIGTARSDNGVEMIFRCRDRLAPGAPVTLRIRAEHAIVYPRTGGKA